MQFKLSRDWASFGFRKLSGRDVWCDARWHIDLERNATVPCDCKTPKRRPK